MKRVYIDMDGVLCNFYDAAKEYIRNNPGVRYPQSIIGFFYNLKEIPGAIESFKKLSEKYDVWILTKPSFRNTNCYTEKADWVRDNLGYEFQKKTILCGDKSLLKGDYLIDDQLNANQEKFEGKLIRFGTKKFDNWNKVLDFFNKEQVNDKLENLDIKEFDYQNYLSMYLDSGDEKYKNKLISRIIEIESVLISLIIKKRYKPKENDIYQKYRDELKIIRKKLKII